VPIIPGFTDSDKNIDEIGAFSAENHFPSVNILPYHKLGATKFERLGGEYKMPDVQTPDNDKMQHIADIIESHGVKCIIN
jgi:pyruvate formate lyase activating enzyme